MTAAPRQRADVLSMARTIGIIPVIRASSADTAIRVIEALVSAGLPVAEVTMTVPNAIEAIAAASRRFGGDVLIAAGTVTDGATARRAIDAGAEMIVSPCLVNEVIEVARSHDVAVVSGALTPTEILAAVTAGADLVKVFPANSVGGPAYLRALRGPFPDLQLVPTGGVTLDNVGDFFRAGAVAVGVGGELVSRELLDKGDYAAIAAMAARFILAVAAARRKSG
jgi:2-dehydro-3-deoxyphosphogluconate aldolase / (4S)-4-hydroxy-2-oxoglutarate aldolase